MNILAVVLVAFLSVFSVGVMSYVSMATPLGPWIEPTIVLCATLLLKLLPFLGMQSLYLKENRERRVRVVALIVAGSSVGGIIATAMGFSFPTLYFLDKDLFISWMRQPLYFWVVTSLLAFVGSIFGFWVANVLEEQFLVEQRLMFPIGQLSYRMILAQNQIRKAKELALGFVSTLLFCWAQAFQVVPRYISLIRTHTIGFVNIPWIRFDFFPMYWAIGFVTGHIIAVPLLVGTVSKIFLLDPVRRVFFLESSYFEFMLEFCSGLIVVSTVFGMINTPRSIWQTICKIFLKKADSKISFDSSYLNNVTNYLGIIAAVPIFAFFIYFKMPIWVLIYLILFTFVCAYQVAYIAGKIGLAQLGRFATFVMLPAFFLFKIDLIQTVFIAVFVELAAGVAADTLFGLKMARLAGVPTDTVKRYQLFGILISAAVVGIIFWALIHKFGLGSEELFVQRAQTRALLLNVTQFNPVVILLGAVFGFILKKLKMNPMLVLSGLLMPINISLGLVAGGLCALYTKNKEEWYPFWSGVFASHSIWMVVNSLMS